MARTLKNLPSLRAPVASLGAWLLACLLTAAPQAHAQDPQKVVVVLHAAVEPNAQARDVRFTEELGLALEGLVVRAQTPERSFADASLAQQLAYVRSLGSDRDVVATVWLREADKRVLLHLVALQTERALVRIVEAEQRPALEAELALLARELLGEAYLFARDRKLAAPVAAAVETVRSAASDPGPGRWELAAFGEADLGLKGSVGPRGQLGAGGGGSLRAWQQLWVVAALHGLAGPSGDTRAVDLRGSEWGGSLGSSYRFAWGKLELGPLVRASVTRRRLDARTDQGAARELRTWGGRIALGGETSFPVAAAARLFVDCSLGARLFKTDLRTRSDGTTLSRTPHLDGPLRVGMALRFQ